VLTQTIHNRSFHVHGPAAAKERSPNVLFWCGRRRWYIADASLRGPQF